MARSWWIPLLLTLLLALGASAVIACGSDDPAPSASQAQAQTEQAETGQQEAEPVGPQPLEPDDDQGDAAATSGPTLHKGLVAEGKNLGDPDAPVVIRYYGDFQ